MKKAKFYANHKVKVMLVVVMSCRDDNAHDVMIIVFIVELDVVKMVVVTVPMTWQWPCMMLAISLLQSWAGDNFLTWQ